MFSVLAISCSLMAWGCWLEVLQDQQSRCHLHGSRCRLPFQACMITTVIAAQTMAGAAGSSTNSHSWPLLAWRETWQH